MWVRHAPVRGTQYWEHHEGAKVKRLMCVMCLVEDMRPLCVSLLKFGFTLPLIGV